MITDKLTFHDEDHTYWLGDKYLPSVTQLLVKHGIAPDYSDAPEYLVRRAGEHGTFVHEEIENYIKTGEMGISDEFQDFMRLVEPLTDTWLSEVMVCTDNYAGRIDLIGITDDEILVVDTKTGQIHMNATAWQTSMYAYAFPNEAKKHVRLFCFDAKPENKSRLIELDAVPDTCIESLVEAERKGEIYNPVRDIIAQNNTSTLALERKIAELENQLKVLKESREKFWNTVKNGMEDAHITAFETPSLKVAYVAPYDQTKVDSERLKAKYPRVYADCKKVSHVKSSIRVTLKGETT